MKQINIIDEICFSLARMINLNLHGKVGHSTQPTSTFLDAINKTWPQKLIKWHQFKLGPKINEMAPKVYKMAQIQNVAPKINKIAPKTNKMAPIQNVA